MKVELNLSVAQAVRLYDALSEATFYAKEGEGKDLLGFAKMMLDKGIKEVERIYDESTIVPNEAEIVMIQSGRRIEAIRLLRKRTGAGLKVCKDAIDRAVPYLYCRWCGKSFADGHTGCGAKSTTMLADGTQTKSWNEL